MACVVLGCKSHSSRKENEAGFISFHRLPDDNILKQMWVDAVSRPNWSWSKSRRICSKHFENDCFIAKDSKWRRLKKSAVPSLRLCSLQDVPQQRTESDGCASHAAGPAEGMVEVKVEQEYFEVEIQDPLQQTDQRSLKEVQVPIEPYMSAVPEIKEEVEEDDYRAMFFKMQDEVTALRITNQSLAEANQILTEQNHKLAKEIETMLEKNKNLATVIEYKNKEHVIFTDRIRELTVHNQCLAEKILSLTEKCNNEFQSGDLRNDSDELQKIGDLTMRLQAVVEENKSLNDEKERLVESNKEMRETVQKLVEDNKRLKRKTKTVLRRYSRLKKSNVIGEETESRRERERETN